MKSMRATSLLLLTLLPAAACGDDAPDPMGPPPSSAEFRSAAVTANPVNEISASVEVNAKGYDAVFLRFWFPGGAPDSTPEYSFNGDTLVTAPVLGMRFDKNYSIEVHLKTATAEDVVDTLGFSTGPRPAWIPFAGAAGTSPTEGYLTVSYPGGAVILDNTARVVWYVAVPNPVLNSFQAHPNGIYTLSNVDETFQVLDELGQQQGTLDCVGFPTRFHEIRILPGGDYWIMCNDERIMDLTSLGGAPDVRTAWTVIQHHSPEGTVLFEWNAFDHFSITDSPADLTTAMLVNVTHGNSLRIAPDGNLIVSFRELNEITKINTATGDVMWRFGGKANEFTILSDPKGSFRHQHGLDLLANGDLQFLDNGAVAPSRLVRYRLDEQAMTATLIMEYLDSPTTFTQVGGSTQVYGNGNALVAFGRAGRVVETFADGTKAWELTGVRDQYIFRAQRIPSLYSPQFGGAVP